MHAVISDNKDKLAELCRRHGVARLEVFGSAAREVDFDPDSSDVDFLVEFDLGSAPATLDQYFDFRDALRGALDRPVDLVESAAVRNPYLRAAIDRSRELIHAS